MRRAGEDNAPFSLAGSTRGGEFLFGGRMGLCVTDIIKLVS